MEKRGRLPNLSTFAFTATPKPKTLELFGTRRADGKFEPFHLYSMRQAIEEGFILDVLANYTTYTAYWRLLKKAEGDPRYEQEEGRVPPQVVRRAPSACESARRYESWWSTSQPTCRARSRARPRR
jgi:hypothetical protein